MESAFWGHPGRFGSRRENIEGLKHSEEEKADSLYQELVNYISNLMDKWKKEQNYLYKELLRFPI